LDWTAEIDAYCERMGPGLWAEPANAFTNLAFLAAAAWLWPRTRGIERVLVALLAAIGMGSGLFHTVATAWAGLADVVPIAAFVLLYLYAANRHYLGWPVWGAALGTALFLPVAALAARGFAMVPGFAASAPYWPVAVLIAAYAVILRWRLSSVAAGLAIGAGMLAVSLVLRSLDGALCPVWSTGTHFAWHLINAAMLGWMITVLRRHRLEPGPPRG
jgi:hypothetical protein